MRQNRAIVIVLDGCGAGEAPDASQFGDINHPSTILHVWESVGGFDTPNLANYGFLKACGINVEPEAGAYGRLREISMGKDSVTGHWEMMGIITPEPFPTYPNGFPKELISVFEQKIGRKVLGNKAASGTKIIQELGEEHLKTGSPIIYTSADSVLQIATHEKIIPLPELYKICRIARELFVAPNNIQRIIARPFIGDSTTGFVRTENRKDFPVEPPHNLIDEMGNVFGIGVIPELFDGRGFRTEKRTQSNKEHAALLFEALNSDANFIFANFEDFDMLYGHRNDTQGFAKSLENFDLTLGKILEKLHPHDLLILTADHGNDPTTPGTDHSREYVPVCLISPKITKPIYLGDVNGMSVIGATIAAHLGIHWDIGENLLKKI